MNLTSKYALEQAREQFTDSRYAINLEWCGQPEQKHVLRFCGVWLGAFNSQDDAEAFRNTHKASRDKTLQGE